MGWVWIFSGTTQFKTASLVNLVLKNGIQKNNVIWNEASEANLNKNNRMFSKKPFLHWVYVAYQSVGLQTFYG